MPGDHVGQTGGRSDALAAHASMEIAVREHLSHKRLYLRELPRLFEQAALLGLRSRPRSRSGRNSLPNAASASATVSSSNSPRQPSDPPNVTILRTGPLPSPLGNWRERGSSRARDERLRAEKTVAQSTDDPSRLPCRSHLSSLSTRASRARSARTISGGSRSSRRSAIRPARRAPSLA